MGEKKSGKMRIPLPPKPGGPLQDHKRKKKTKDKERRQSIENGFKEFRDNKKGER